MNIKYKKNTHNYFVKDFANTTPETIFIAFFTCSSRTVLRYRYLHTFGR